MSESIDNPTDQRRVRFAFCDRPEHRPVVINRWEVRAEFYCARMDSPQICYFEISSIDSEATLQALKDKVVAKMRARLEQEIGDAEITFTFRNLGECRPGVANICWNPRSGL